MSTDDADLRAGPSDNRLFVRFEPAVGGLGVHAAATSSELTAFQRCVG